MSKITETKSPTPHVIIGRRIAELRAERGMTQQDFAAASGLRQEQLSRIERGKYNIGIDLLARIGDALNMDIDFVVRP